MTDSLFNTSMTLYVSMPFCSSKMVYSLMNCMIVMLTRFSHEECHGGKQSKVLKGGGGVTECSRWKCTLELVVCWGSRWPVGQVKEYCTVPQVSLMPAQVYLSLSMCFLTSPMVSEYFIFST